VRPSVVAGEPILVIVMLPPSTFGGVRRVSGGGDVRASPHVQHSLSARSPLSTLAVASYEWVRDEVWKYKSFLTSLVSVIALQCQVKLENP